MYILEDVFFPIVPGTQQSCCMVGPVLLVHCPLQSLALGVDMGYALYLLLFPSSLTF